MDLGADNHETELQRKKDEELRKAQEALAHLNKVKLMDHYSQLRSEREKATFTMMMKMNPEALTHIRKEFFARDDALTLDEFMFVINKWLVNTDGGDHFEMQTAEQREFGANMYELFKDIDINGDGDLEWQEFTSFVVEKANLLNKRQKLATLAHYHDSTHALDPSASYRHRNDLSRIVNLPTIGQFAMMEDNKRAIYLFNNRTGKQVCPAIPTDAAPIAMCPLAVAEKGKNITVATFSDMTMATYNFEGSLSTRYKPTSIWATPGVQMALAYMPANQLLYSGATNGDVHAWRTHQRKKVCTMSGHTDICMSLCVLKKLDYLASASLDTTVSVWDSFTNERLLHLHGHKKGILDLTYSAEYRLLISCGFEHDALVWSPFVKNLVYKLKGHHGALCGVRCVENTPELITADVTGVFKLWDVRKFECVQTFTNVANQHGLEDNSRLSCFEFCTLKPHSHMQKEDDSRIYAGTKQILSFDQARVVHAATTDKSKAIKVFWVRASSSFITVSAYNVIVWDALIGSKTVVNEQMNGDVEITAACLDDRERKMVVGDANGCITVYNHLNGQHMKTSSGRRNVSAVISLEYLSELIRFIAGYENGLIRVFDENPIEDCNVVRTFDPFNMHPELLGLVYDPHEDTMLTAGSTDGIVRLWDFTAAKCEVEYHPAGDEGYVVFVHYLDPLPLVVTSDSLCNITIWGSRGVNFRMQDRIAGFYNQATSSSQLEPPIKTNSQTEEPRPRRVLAPEIDEAIAEAEREVREALCADIDTNPHHRPRHIDEMKLDESEAHAALSCEEANKLWGTTTAAQCISWDSDLNLLFAADDLGTLRCYDLNNCIADITASMELDEADLLMDAESGSNASVGGDGNYKTLEEEDAVKWRCRKFPKGICRKHERNVNSALPPMPVPTQVLKKRAKYILGIPNDAMSYQGVNFVWSVHAHDNRIATCACTGEGILTSGADLLVKMWTYDGLPLGVLLQSIPIGRRSQKWSLMLDAAGIMKAEDDELDGIIEEVQELVESDKPDINDMDFTAMEPGAGAEDFTRSELRQRIEKTSELLGIHFPTEGEDREEADGIFDPQDPDIGSEASLGKVKHLDNALRELRSTLTASDFKEGSDERKSEMQIKREAKKYEELSKRFEEVGGMKVGPPGSSSGVVDEDIDMDEVRSMVNQEHGEGHNEGHTEKEDKEEKHDLNQSSVDFNDLQSLSESLGLPGSVSGIGVNLKESINKATLKGARTQSIIKKCNRYTNWSRLEDALTGNFDMAGGKGTGSIGSKGTEPGKKTRKYMEKVESLMK